MHHVHHARASMFGLFHHPKHYERMAAWLLRGLYSRVVADVAAARLPDGSRLLDVGSGPGRVPLAIADALPGLRVDAVDLSPQMIERARRRAVETGRPDRVSFVAGDVADLPYPDDSFDLVISTMSQHHWPDAAAGFREIRRVLRPAGQAWIYDLRPAMTRAEPAARAAFPGYRVGVEVSRTRRFPPRLTGRLVIAPERADSTTPGGAGR